MTALPRPTILPPRSGVAPATAMPPLTSLVDMMTILLVFLLQSFSSEGSLFTPTEDLKIPESTARKKAPVALTVEVSRRDVMVDGRFVVSVADVDRNDSLVVPPLLDWLSGVAALSREEKIGREIVIECDRNTDFRILKKVMATCARASWSDFSLLVLEKGG